MYKNLNHLSSKEKSNLMQRYYNGEPVATLLEEYALSVHASELYKLFPPEVYQKYSCEYCGEHLVLDRVSKTSLWKTRYMSELYCPICGHKPYEEECTCSNCAEKKIQLRKHQLKQISDVYSAYRPVVNFSDLSFESKVYLGALCFALMKENMFEIKPYIDSNVVLAPTQNLCKQIYDQLIKENIIAVSPNSPLSAFVLDADNFPHTYYRNAVTYYLNLLFPNDKQELFTEILNPSYYAPEYETSALALWKKIAVAECIEYLDYQLKKVGFDFTPGDKTHKIFEILLNDFSVSQIYGIIWKAVADSSKLYLERGITKKHAANSVIGACERYAERAKMNGWTLTEYNRIKELPQSALSFFFFNRVLKIGDLGFKMPPDIV